MLWSNPTAEYQGYQPHISRISSPFVHRILWVATPWSIRVFLGELIFQHGYYHGHAWTLHGCFNMGTWWIWWWKLTATFAEPQQSVSRAAIWPSTKCLFRPWKNGCATLDGHDGDGGARWDVSHWDDDFTLLTSLFLPELPLKVWKSKSNLWSTHS